jgi:acyl carrier protein
MSIDEQLESVFQNVFNNPFLTLRDDMTAKDVPGWDSLGHINLMFAIEQAFGFQFAGNELAEFRNIGELKQYLAQHAAY